MIGKDEIAEGVRYADARVEETGDMPAFWTSRDVDIEGLMYVAMQRGLRVVMIEKGISPNQQRPATVPLTFAEQQRQAKYASIFMDGFAAAWESKP